MSISENATNVLNVLLDHSDPLTRAELAELTSTSEVQAVKAIIELSELYDISKTILGYKLEPDQDIIPLATASPRERLLAMLATSQTRLYAKTFSKPLALSTRKVMALLTSLLDEQYVNHRQPGTYYLTPAGLEHIRLVYPQLKVSPNVEARVEHDSKDHVAPFRIKTGPSNLASTVISDKLNNIDQKINLLNDLAKTLPDTNARQLIEVIAFLQYQQELAA